MALVATGLSHGPLAVAQVVPPTDPSATRPPTAGLPHLVLQVGHAAGVRTSAFSPDGRLLAAGDGNGVVKLWDVRSGVVRASLRVSAGQVTSLAFSPDGRTLAACGFSANVQLWDVATGTRRAELAHSAFELAFSPDGRTLAVGTNSDTIELWDPTARALRSTLRGAGSTVHALAFSPDGRTVASGSFDQVVRLWDVAAGTLRASLRGHTSEVDGIAFSPDGRVIASVGTTDVPRLWDAATGAPRGTLRGARGGMLATVFSPDGRTVAAAGWDKSVHLWDAATGALRATLQGHTRVVGTLAFSPDGHALASGSDDQTLRVWDPATGALQATLQGEANAVTVAVFSPDGRVLATASADKVVRVWDLSTGLVRTSLRGHTALISSLSFSADGHTLASGSWDRTVRLWDLSTGALRATLQTRTGPVMTLALSPDGRTLASSSCAARDGIPADIFLNRDERAFSAVQLWDVATSTLRATLRGHLHPVIGMVFSPDGRTLATSSWDSTVRLWDASAGAPRATLRGAGFDLRSLAFSPDGSTLATGDRSGPVRVWEVSTGASRSTLGAAEGHGVESVAFSPDGRTLASSHGDGAVRVWDLTNGSLRQTVANAAGDYWFLAGTGHAGDVAWVGDRLLSVLYGSGNALRLVRPIEGGAISLRTFEADGHASALAYTFDGLFAGDEQAFPRVTYRLGDDVVHGDLVTADQLFEQFHRPSLVADFMAGRSLELSERSRLGVGLPPEVAFIAPPTGVVTSERVEVRVRATDRGGGVSEVQIFVNGARVNPPPTGRGLAVVADPNATTVSPDGQITTITLALSPGENLIEAKAISVVGRVESERAQARVTLTARAEERPNLRLLAISFNRYENPDQNLSFANPDADALVAALRAQQGRLYNAVDAIVLQDAAATRDAIERAFAQLAQRARPSDVLVVYGAGHGMLARCEGDSTDRYHLLTYQSDLRSDRTICAQGLSDQRLAGLIHAVPARKKLLILDTCQAGGAATGDMVVAMRGAGEVDAIRRLGRSEGVAVVAAALALQSAGEVPRLGHGIFTYALLQGLGGQAPHTGAAVTVFGLLNYVQDQVATLAEREFHHPQYPITSTQGQDFPIALP